MASKRWAMRSCSQASIGWFQGNQRQSQRGLVIGCYGFWGVKSRQRSPADAVHLQRALDALRVVGRQARGRGRVHARQRGVHRGPAFLPRLGVQLCPYGGVGRGHVVQAMRQRLEIQHGAAHQQRQPPARADLADQAARIQHEFGSAVGLPGVADVDQVVRDGGEFGCRGLGGADVHAAVHQRRIDADDLHVVALRDRQRGRRLAAGRGAGQADGATCSQVLHVSAGGCARAAAPASRRTA
jgi:hypothetical protein